MGVTDKIEDKAQELKGHAKQAAGGATGDRKMQAEGLKDEKSGQVKQAGEKVKDVFR
ncbi:MAG: CsbD-like protein [Frankiales bacterium]|nr:CsbD-like protein [Frankiales bacterium]